MMLLMMATKLDAVEEQRTNADVAVEARTSPQVKNSIAINSGKEEL